MGNPLMVFLACLLMVGIQNRLRLNEFKYKKIIEKQNLKLQEKDDQISKELMLAKNIQDNLIPQVLPAIPGVKIHTIYRPMEQVGGDFFNFIEFNEKNLHGIFIGDVSGHGVPAALITSMVKTLIDTAGHLQISPLSMLHYIHDKIKGQTAGNFITILYAIYDSDKRTLLIARGGHMYPYLIDKGRITELVSRGRCLGMMDNIDLEEKTFQLEKGDKILLYTDGLSEALNSANESFEKTLRTQSLAYYRDMHIKDYIDNVYKDLVLFRGNDNFSDDICVIGMEVL
jgi:serine phosphatase RsbU (regulator of sigma subunit)